MYSVKTTIVNPTGLHARPASEFVAEAKKYSSKIYITNLSEYPDEPSNAKSIMEVLTLAMYKGTETEIKASGEDEKEAVDALVAMIQRGFGEI